MLGFQPHTLSRLRLTKTRETDVAQNKDLSGELDPAIVRRAARTEEFARPSDQEREELFRMDLEGLNIKDQTICELVRLTGPREGGPALPFRICAPSFRRMHFVGSSRAGHSARMT
jgi:hypothetical protein